MKVYDVQFSRKISYWQHKTVQVEAPNKREAKRSAKEDPEKFDLECDASWDDSDSATFVGDDAKIIVGDVEVNERATAELEQ